MQGFDVVTSDDHKVGHVVGEEGNYLIVEHGTLFKSKHAVPKTVAQADEGARVVRVSIAREILEHAPTLDPDRLDERAVAEYYGLADAYADPETEGYGDLDADETAVSSEVQAREHGVETAVEERAAIRANLQAQREGPPGESPGLLGDRHAARP